MDTTTPRREEPFFTSTHSKRDTMRVHTNIPVRSEREKVLEELEVAISRERERSLVLGFL